MALQTSTTLDVDVDSLRIIFLAPTGSAEKALDLTVTVLHNTIIKLENEEACESWIHVGEMLVNEGFQSRKTPSQPTRNWLLILSLC